MSDITMSITAYEGGIPYKQTITLPAKTVASINKLVDQLMYDVPLCEECGAEVECDEDGCPDLCEDCRESLVCDARLCNNDSTHCHGGEVWLCETHYRELLNLLDDDLDFDQAFDVLLKGVDPNTFFEPDWEWEDELQRDVDSYRSEMGYE